MTGRWLQVVAGLGAAALGVLVASGLRFTPAGVAVGILVFVVLVLLVAITAGVLELVERQRRMDRR